MQSGNRFFLYKKLVAWLEKRMGRIDYEGRSISIDFDSLTKYSDFFRFGKGLEKIALRGIDKNKNEYEVIVALDEKGAGWRLETVKRSNE